MAHSYDPYENVRNVMSDAAKMAGIDSPYMEIIKCPQRETKVYLPVEMDDGSVHVFEGYRVQHSNIRGPFKGGSRTGYVDVIKMCNCEYSIRWRKGRY